MRHPANIVSGIVLAFGVATSGVASAAAPLPAPLAKTTLDYTITNVTCTLTTPSGASTVACSASPSIVPTIFSHEWGPSMCRTPASFVCVETPLSAMRVQPQPRSCP